MTSLPILRFPDARLRLKAEPVTLFDAGLHALVADLVEAMRAAPGIGITASHLGIAKRVVVIELPGEDAVRTYINPCVVDASQAMARHPEGSVSMPGVTDEVERPASVRVRYQDKDGHERVEDADGLLAVCLQHEIDQLDGLFWIERLSRLKRERLVKRYEKLEKRRV